MYASPFTFLSEYTNHAPNVVSIRYFECQTRQTEATPTAIVMNWAARDKIADVCFSMEPPRDNGIDRLIKLWSVLTGFGSKP